MRTKKITFENSSGHKLAALLDLPVDDDPIAYALFAHCFTCSKDYKGVARVSRALAAEGVAVLRFDFTGLGESEGDFSDTTFSSNVADLVAAADFLDRELEAPKILIGHSLGGAAVLQAAARIPSATAVATIAAPSSTDHLAGMIRSSNAEIDRIGEAEVEIAGRPFRIRKEFLDDLSAMNMRDAIANLGRALMVFHSPLDTTVGIDHAMEIFQAAQQPKSFISLDRADHLLSGADDARYVGSMIAAWARRFFGAPQEERRTTSPGDNLVVVRTEKGYRTEILANGHPLIADEPLGVGGTNAGPTPYELLTSALGACTSITLRMYADRKGWPLDAVEVRLHHEKVHCDDCAGVEGPGGRIDRFTREITLEGALDEEQRQRMLQIADRCPVHRTLEKPAEVTTTLVENQG
ncbi:MAG: bifunctional alpha/beta hydrolase/OsmC family protein [Thermoanaerobaculales bacterium]|nr:bifunctional alpha/beta hydrolase/OsmC family protein [Thermoanaerobaculales bacterium]